MKSKLWTLPPNEEVPNPPRYFIFWCPGCNESHSIPVDGSRGWIFKGTTECPTIEPSLRIMDIKAGTTSDCHVVITNGVLNFCADCVHELAGKSVPMVDYPETP